MADAIGNNKRIAQNTFFLYLRMLFTMVVSLYTSRIVLSTLGIEDFGIYNVVGGIVAMFGFINGSMTTSTQRYITFALGKKDENHLSDVFCTSLIIHGFISIIVVILGETIGLWFLCNKMQIPVERMEAALWVYQCSIGTSIVLILSIPYNAVIIAYERMSAFAYISIFEVITKLLVVYLLFFISSDKLILYSILILTVQILIRLCYSWYCRKVFAITEFKWIWDIKLLKEMTGLAGWSMFGNLAYISFTQGINILLNIFFGPTINAARAISVQIQNTVNQLSFNFQMALNPQITKSYASGNMEYMHSLVLRSSKFTYYLLLILSLPLFIETDAILRIWLNNFPSNTVVFVRLMLGVTILDAMANPLIVSATATGRIKYYQLVLGGILLTILPISYVVLKMGASPSAVFIVHLGVCICSFVVRLLFLKYMINLSLNIYFKEVCFRILCVTVPGGLFLILIYNIVPHSILGCIILYFTSMLVFVSLICYWGLDDMEKQFVLRKIKENIQKFEVRKK